MKRREPIIVRIWRSLDPVYQGTLSAVATFTFIMVAYALILEIQNPKEMRKLNIQARARSLAAARMGDVHAIKVNDIRSELNGISDKIEKSVMDREKPFWGTKPNTTVARELYRGGLADMGLRQNVPLARVSPTARKKRKRLPWEEVGSERQADEFVGRVRVVRKATPPPGPGMLRGGVDDRVQGMQEIRRQ